MSLVKYLLAVSAVACGLLLTGAAKAEAAGTRYGVVTLKNPTDDPINYQFRWGQDGEWVAYTVDAGMQMYHWCELDDDDTAPRPYVRFDYILNDGEITWKTMPLQFYSARKASAAAGKKYTFRVTRNGTQLNLFPE